MYPEKSGNPLGTGEMAFKAFLYDKQGDQMSL
jgi:hypothetical protein